MPTPRRRWSTRSPAGTRHQRGGSRRRTGTATPGVRTHVQMVNISAKTGWPGPMSPSNQNTISTPAQISIPLQYATRTFRSCCRTLIRSMDLAFGDGSVLTRRSCRRTLEFSCAAQGLELCCREERCAACVSWNDSFGGCMWTPAAHPYRSRRASAWKKLGLFNASVKSMPTISQPSSPS